MNALYVIHKYFEIKAGKKPARPITVIFGAKAAPAYVIAKDIIHLILCLTGTDQQRFGGFSILESCYGRKLQCNTG